MPKFQKHVVGEFETFHQCFKFLDSKEFVKLLNANEIELSGDFSIIINHDAEELCYHIILIEGEQIC